MGVGSEVKCFLSELPLGGGVRFQFTRLVYLLILQGQVHLSKLFSIREANGIKIRIVAKYIVDATWPIIMKGWFTGWLPIHVRINRIVIRSHSRNWLSGRKDMLCCLDLCNRGITARIRIDSRSANTPPSLLGTDRRIAYANRKYHSGLMCGGVLSGLAGV